MLNRDDRRDLACLGLMVLVYGLVAAPVLHTVVGHAGASRQHVHAHGTGGVEHSHGPGEHGGAAARGAERDARKGHGRDAPGVPDESAGAGPDGHQHLTGSVEHLSGVVAAWAGVELPRVRWVSWLAQVRRGPSRIPGAAPRPTAMPQGP